MVLDGGALIKAFLTDQAVFFIELVDRLAATGYREMRRHRCGGFHRRMTMTPTVKALPHDPIRISLPISTC
jgi:hypothetical protein